MNFPTSDSLINNAGLVLGLDTAVKADFEDLGNKCFKPMSWV